MRIGFDAKRLFNNFTGLGNYSRFIVNALLASARDDELILYTPKASTRDHPDVKPIATATQVKVVTPSAFYRWTGTTSLWRSFGIAHDPSAKQLDVFHGLSQELPSGLPRQVKKVVTVHDLIFLRFPELYSAIDARIYRYKVARACRDADVIVAISQQTAQDIMSFLGTDESRIRVIYQGTHGQFSRKVPESYIDKVRARHAVPAEYMLTVGTVEPRKNMLAAVKALARLPKASQLPLVIVGRETAYKQTIMAEAQALGIGSLVLFLHQVSFSDLPGLYQGARLFIYPSLFEGFGIPIVEALQSGVPVVTSTGSCFSEAGGPATLYADPGNPDDLAFHLLRVLSDRSLQQKMICAGSDYVRKFAPEAIAAELMSVYRE